MPPSSQERRESSSFSSKPAQTRDEKIIDQGPPVEEKEEKNLLLILKEALKKEKIEFLIQPIVSLPQRKVKYYECFSQIRDSKGTIYYPQEFLFLPEAPPFLTLMDNMTLLRCLGIIRKAQKRYYRVVFFCNIALTTLMNEKFFKNFTDFISSNPDIAQNFVLEFDIANFEIYRQEVLPYLQKLATLGCSFSVDHLKTFHVDFPQYANYNVRFLKVDLNLLLEALKSTTEIKKINRFKTLADHYKMKIIVTKIESEKHLLEILDFHFELGQGFLFCPPQIHLGFGQRIKR